MVKMILEDDCLAPKPQIEINYKGPNPFKAYLITSNQLKRILGVRGKDIWEREFRWDLTGDPRGFFVKIYAKKKFDGRTAAFIEITFLGHQPTDPKKVGDLTIKISGKLKTNFGGSTIFTHPKNPFYRFLINIYFSMFYAKVRRGFIKRCEGYIMKLRQKYMEVLGIKK
ncbi:MAG TPA: hypothetical protein ENG45_00145 [Candidatus Aenigmarchaeota archaeon]|nr:hypothetical protein [Candidatus Aenigmarchaeota archaeon]